MWMQGVKDEAFGSEQLERRQLLASCSVIKDRCLTVVPNSGEISGDDAVLGGVTLELQFCSLCTIHFDHRLDPPVLA
jgi:hypothetical protein